MAIVTMILGESGTGKSTSLRNLNPAKTVLFQPIAKPLPFKSKEWTPLTTSNVLGSIRATDDAERIIKAMNSNTVLSNKDVIVIDDFQYIMANEFMRRSHEKSFDKFNDIGRHAWDILDSAIKLPDHIRVYILAHTNTDDFGKTKIKTIGKMLDEKITLEGMVTTVLRTQVIDGSYKFSTQNNGFDTVKSPMDLFAERLIDNDLQAVDNAICDYYGIEAQPTETTNKEAA